MEKKIALVTGATRGIGKAIALTLAQYGHIVIGSATTEAGAKNIADMLSSFGGDGVVLDIASKDSIDATIKTITEKYGDIAILVNNAGITKDTLFLRMSDDDWDQVINTNLTSIFRLSKAVIRGMTKARWGRIINLTSIVAFMGNPGQVNYSSAKAGILGFTKSLASELGSRNITVNCVAPGFIATDMTDKIPEDIKATLISKIPLGKIGDVNDIAHAVKFLASDEASYITGNTIHVNGGMHMA